VTTPPLFDMADPDPGAASQKCDLCESRDTASTDGLRARGWVAYNGASFTGKTLAVRLCPACRRGI
jgi:hypothetical protein